MIFSFRDMATTQIIKTTGNDKKKDKYRENRKHIQAGANSGNNTNIENLFVFAKNSDKQEQIRGTIPISKTFIFRIKQQRTGK